MIADFFHNMEANELTTDLQTLGIDLNLMLTQAILIDHSIWYANLMKIFQIPNFSTLLQNPK